ncbi:L-lactate dehydrogenase [Adlercreutzia faecimuris]|uniref:L-lactate dehydrogenase n=1 Tax=Adlercreutzia faecimuris TaxID=2897341 RepID=A0ABS9WIQ3_9ACTN|nr:L-lactate dehydrogenase [Adlercreutzia sp. JBNU-10]MCI2242415.1 L-lactate dehydrogenase [Adlercreutzia sp. JBNU-10]
MGRVNDRKVAVIGCGFVGAASAFALLESGLFSEMVLIDVDAERAEGEALDISHGMAFASPMSIYAGTYDDIADAGVIVVTAGVGQKPGETRIDLVHRNVEVFRGIMGEIRARDCGGILLVVSNPVDVLTYAAIRLSGMPESRVIGSGTVLDTARLKQIIGERLEVDPRNVHARILGEHGDSEIIAWSSAHVAGIPLEDFYNMRADGSYDDFRREMTDLVRNAAYEIIRRKKATYYGIALTVKRICEAIVRDEKSVLSVSNVLHGEFGIEDVALSTPCIVGRGGIEGRLPPSLNYAEQQSLKASAALLREVIDGIDFGDAAPAPAE